MTPKTTERVTVLIIEDDPWVAEVNRGMLEIHPAFQVVGVAGTLQEASLLLTEIQPELLLVDIYLPDGSGLEWVRQKRAAGMDTEVIMVTAANDASSVQHALRDGVLDYLIKPFEQPRLLDALERFLSRRQLLLSSSFTQSKLDRLLRHDPETHLPKGIERSTLEKIQELLMEAKAPLGAEEAGAQLHLSRVTAWRYLEYLTEKGWASTELTYQKSGRPQKSYVVRSRTS